jgi:hypothetical protein
MKPKKTNSRLSLKKVTISNLKNTETRNIYGGISRETCGITWCVAHCSLQETCPLNCKLPKTD